MEYKWKSRLKNQKEIHGTQKMIIRIKEEPTGEEIVMVARVEVEIEAIGGIEEIEEIEEIEGKEERGEVEVAMGEEGIIEMVEAMEAEEEMERVTRMVPLEEIAKIGEIDQIIEIMKIEAREETMVIEVETTRDTTVTDRKDEAVTEDTIVMASKATEGSVMEEMDKTTKTMANKM